MQKKIVFRHMDHSQVMEDFANQHLVKIERMLENESSPIHIEMVLESASTHKHHTVELRIKTPNYDLISKREGAEMYQEIDKVCDIMLSEIRKAKDKRIDRRDHTNLDK